MQGENPDRGSSPRGARTRQAVLLLLPYLALVLIHLSSGLERQQPLILADELGYLGNARYLAGAAPLPDMQGRAFYHFGYSLLLVPAFWLFADPVLIYQAALGLNALLAASLFFALYQVLRSALQAPGSVARWVAFACSLYPSLHLYSSFAWSENAFVPLYVAAIALFARFLATRASRDLLLLSLVTGFLYTVHPRALPILVALVGYLLALTLLRLLRARQLLLSAATIGALFVATRTLNQHLKAMGWAGGGELAVTKLAGRLVPDTDFMALIERAFGQVLYLAQASHGFFLLGLLLMIWLIVRGTASRSPRQLLADPATGVAVFVLLASGGVLLAACSAKLYSLHGPAGVRGADLIHGRYNEAFAVLAMAFALAAACRRRFWGRRIVWRTLAVAAVLWSLTLVVMTEAEHALQRQVAGIPEAQPSERILASEVDAIAVPGVYPLVSLLGALDLQQMSLAVTVSFVLILATLRLSWRGGLVLLMSLFVWFSYANHRDYLLPAEAKAAPRLTFVSQLRRLGPIAAISYDTAYLERGFFPGIQYLLQETVFRRFDSRAGELPTAEAVISGHDWPQADHLGARFVFSAEVGDNVLWLLPGELRSRIPDFSHEGVTLGRDPVFGVRESGFHRPAPFDELPGRWTDGAASLRVPLDPRSPPRMLGIETIAPGRDGVRLQVLANGVELWNRRIPPTAWSRTLYLKRVPLGDELLVEIRSDTFSPGPSAGGAGDQRRLGVLVRGIRLATGVSYEGVMLGAEHVVGVQESGFHLAERFDGRSGRWTNGAARLRVPLDPREPPRTLTIETLAPRREGAWLQVLANGIELGRQPVPSAGWSRTFRLDGVPLEEALLIELNSDVFSPAESVDGSRDERVLGVVVTGIRLTARAPYEGLTLGVERIIGVQETGFHLPERIDGRPGRWTNGDAALRVPLDPRHPPRRLEIETSAPGRDGVRLQVLADGVELWHRKIPAGPWSTTLSLEDLPLGDELLIELKSDTFSPGWRPWRPRDGRRLGVVVRGIRLTGGQEGGETPRLQAPVG